MSEAPEEEEENSGLGNSFEDEDVWGSGDTTGQQSSHDVDVEETTENESTSTNTTIEDNHKANAKSTTSSENADSDGSKTYKKDDLPHKLIRNNVKEGRSSLTIFLSEEDMGIINRLRYVADNTFDENIQSIDVYVAAMRCGITGSEEEVKNRFIEEMESIGYGF